MHQNGGNVCFAASAASDVTDDRVYPSVPFGVTSG